MKTARQLILIITLLLLAPFAQAQSLVNHPDLVINSLLKKLDEKILTPAKGPGSISEKSEKWE